MQSKSHKLPPQMPGSSSGSDVVFFEQVKPAELQPDLFEQFPLHTIEAEPVGEPRFVQRGTIPSLVVTSPEHAKEAEDIPALIAERAQFAAKNVIVLRAAHLGDRHVA